MKINGDIIQVVEVFENLLPIGRRSRKVETFDGSDVISPHANLISVI
jgi:hypothetical protein